MRRPGASRQVELFDRGESFDADGPAADGPQRTAEPGLAIPGLRYFGGFLTEAEEVELVRLVDAGQWNTAWERRRQLFGQTYGARREIAAPLPDWGRALAERLAAAADWTAGFDQMLVNEYWPGQGIALHRDYEPFDRTVASLSLLSACVMDFRRASDGRRDSLLLAPRSLLLLSDEARYEWEHGIARRKNDRWRGAAIPRGRRLSITFRRYVGR